MALLAISAFIASAASTLSLQVDLLGDCGKSDGEFIEYMLVWSAKFDEVPETLPIKQLSGPGLLCLKMRHWRKPLSVLHTTELPFLHDGLTLVPCHSGKSLC